MLFFNFVVLLSLAVGSFSRNDFRRNPSRPRRNLQNRQHHHHLRNHQYNKFGRREGEMTIQPVPNDVPPPSGSFKLEVSYKGEDFFNGWEFFDQADPTHGSVNYQRKEDALSKHLAYVEGGVTVLAVDDTTPLQPGQKRDSVRISTSKRFNGGLFIADFAQMPVGCSTWPAYWSVGPDWPSGGEIDVLEGVHNQAVNQYTLHTSDGCEASTGGTQVTSQPGGTRCASSGGDNTGCAFHDTDARSYGNGFNGAGGGVYAHFWNHDGIKMWHFARGEIPADIESGSPNPSAWGTPQAFFSSGSCDMASHFHDHQLVIDTTLCGDWAGATYASAGCPGSCEEAVADPNNFKNAKWKVNHISVYQSA